MASARQQIRARQLLQRRLELDFGRRFQAELDRFYKQAYKATITGSSVEAALPEHERRLTDLYDKLYHVTTAESLAIANFKRKYVEMTPLADQIAADFMVRAGSKKVTQIVSTSIDQARTEIANMTAVAIRESIPIREQASLLYARFRSISLGRAQTIARTETHSTMMGATHEGALITGIEMKREWVAAGDGRLQRESHAAAHGQIVGMTEPFIVDGEQLMYPGDMSGSVGNTINCRCDCVYNPI